MENNDMTIKDFEDIDEVEVIENKELFDKAVARLNSYGLNWTFRSIEYIVNRENLTLNQLRSCIFEGTDGKVRYDLEKATRYIIACGLVNSKTVTKEDFDACIDKAYDIMDDWVSEIGFIGTLQILMINTMEKKHFFMGTQDIKVLNHLVSVNCQKDMVMNQVGIDMQMKVAQSQAMQS